LDSIPGLLKSLKIPSLIHGDGEASFFLETETDSQASLAGESKVQFFL
jgi:hypothetical protein